MAIPLTGGLSGLPIVCQRRLIFLLRLGMTFLSVTQVTKALAHNDMISGFGGVLLCCTSDILKRLLLGTTNVVMYYPLTALLEKSALQP